MDLNVFLFIGWLIFRPMDPSDRVKQAVKPALSCGEGLTLTAAGACRPGSAGAKCGPSYRFVAALSQCRKL